MPAPSAPGRRTGRLVVLEGIDGAGKTTVAERIELELQAQGIELTRTREPTQSEAGQAVRRILSDPEHDPVSEALLFAADHATHTAWLREQLSKGKLVLSDRYSTSWLVYQSLTLRSVWPEQSTLTPREWLDHVVAPLELSPDLVLLLDLPVEAAMARMGGRGEQAEKFEEAAFLEEVREAYLQLARERGFVTIDATLSPEATAAACLEPILELIQEGRAP